MANTPGLTKEAASQSNNPYAIAHAINSTHLDHFLREPCSISELKAHAAERLYHCHQHLNAQRPTTPTRFRQRLMNTGDRFNDYTVLLNVVDQVPTTRDLLRYFDERDGQGGAETALQTITDRLSDFDPPAAPPDPEDTTAAQAAMTKNQRNQSYRKERRHLTLGIRPFMALFGNALLTELFIAGHRWPDGRAQCPRCQSRQTSLFQFTYEEEEEHPEVLPTSQAGPAIGWHCAKCDRDFTVTTDTIMAEPNLPCADWLHMAFWMLHDRGGHLTYDIQRTAGSWHGMIVTKRQAETMRDKIHSILPFARPNVRSRIANIDALKMLAAAGTGTGQVLTTAPRT